MTPEALAETHQAAFDDDRPWQAGEFALLLGQKGVILAGDTDSYVLARVTADEAEILTLATHPSCRREGRAQKALAQCMIAAREAGATRLFLEVAADNAPARALYTAAGFVEAGRRKGYYVRKGATAIDAIIMQRDLTQG